MARKEMQKIKSRPGLFGTTIHYEEKIRRPKRIDGNAEATRRRLEGRLMPDGVCSDKESLCMVWSM